MIEWNSINYRDGILVGGVVCFFYSKWIIVMVYWLRIKYRKEIIFLEFLKNSYVYYFCIYFVKKKKNLKSL